MKQLKLCLSLCFSFNFLIAANNQDILVRRIDALVDTYYKENSVQANKPLSDDAFVRRIYLDVLGRIPTLTEFKSFRASNSPNKRNLLIDSLIHSKGQVSHSFNYWADVLRYKDKLRNGSGENYKDFIKKSLTDNKPYNEFVSELLKSNGSAFEYENGATGYYLRDVGMPLDNLSMTMQVFLGTSMVCAQCHDHPFNDWTQLDFYKVAGFNAGINAKTHLAKNTRFKGIDVKEKQKDNQFKRIYKKINETLVIGVKHQGSGQIRLPDNYQYDDAEAKGIVKAEVPYGKPISLNFAHPEISKSSKSRSKKGKSKTRKKSGLTDINSRGAFADWLTSDENPMFTKVIVNRLWRRVMGLNLVGELDDLELDDMGQSPNLTKELIRQMKLLNYDMKSFMAILYKTKLYQREVGSKNIAYRQDYHFEGPVLKRLSSEQLWDSFLSLVIENPDLNVKTQFPMNKDNLLYADLNDKSGEEIIAIITDIQADGKKGITNYMKSISTMDSMMGMQVKQQSQLEAGKLKLKKLGQQIKLAAKKKDKNTVKKLKIEQKKLSVQVRNMNKGQSKNKSLQRASELTSPAPTSHFLRRFGQSEREEHDAASTESSIPQALTLLNGRVEDYLILNKSSVINANLEQAKTVSEKISVAYQSILNRDPLAKEKELFELLFMSNAEKAQGDLIWVLVNSHEFKFNK
jgi:hypothetical protein